jgi:hypothetical protein
MKKILIYQVDSPYGALKSFMDCIIQAFREKNVDVTVIDFAKKDAMVRLADCVANHYDAVLSFNCYISGIKLNNGSYLQDCIDAPYFYFLLDHPMHHHKILKEPLKNFHAICVDSYFVDYIQKFYPHIKTVHMIPHGGMTDGAWIPYEDRDIDVLFTGSYKSIEDLKELMEKSPEPARSLSLDMTCELLENPGMRQEEAFSKILKHNNIQLTDAQYADWISTLGNLVDHYIRGVYRNKMLEAMSDKKYKVEVYGEDWQNCPIQASNIHYHDAVDYNENISLMNRSKIVLNTYTGFRCGAHERIFTSMMAKALCMTDSNEYIQKNFRDKENIVIFSYQKMDIFEQQIQYYLRNPHEAGQIAKNGYEIANKQHTWRNRAEQILALV